MTKKLCVSAMMLALAFVLSYFAVFHLPNGGSVTIGSMVPIILISLLYGSSWGFLSAVAFAVLQMVISFYPPPTQTFVSFALAVLLDYIIAFGVIGFAGVIYRKFGRKAYMIPISGAIVVFLRFVCHVASGMLVWSSYAPEGQPLIVYSLVYNGSYMLCELAITTAILVFSAKFLQNQIIRLQNG